MEENNTKIVKTIPNIESNIPKGKRNVLSYQDAFLVPCSIDEGDDSFDIVYNVNDLRKLSDVDFEDELEMLRTLSLVGNLKSLINRYDFSLSPTNIYIDKNNNPMILERNIGSIIEDDFLKKYKALIACIINPSYSFEDYYLGGTDLFSKNKEIKTINSLDSIDEIVEKLDSLERDKRVFQKDNYIKVSRNSNKVHTVLIPILSSLLVFSLLLSSYFFFYELPFKRSEIAAYEAYLAGDYINTENALAKYDTSRLSYLSKYILAISYLRTADLSTAEKQAELQQITTITEEVLFDYWIHIGRQNYEEAIDDAQRLNSEAHLFYAYVCYKSYVETNLAMTGSEKESLLNEINQKISTLQASLNSSFEDGNAISSENFTVESSTDEEGV